LDYAHTERELLTTGRSRFVVNYERIETLWAHDEIVLVWDEKPNMQALERAHPTQPMCAGQIERQLVARLKSNLT